jgi:hypothetical protein
MGTHSVRRPRPSQFFANGFFLQSELRGDVGAPNASGNYGQVAFKFGTVGFGELAKQIQLSVTGGRTEDLAKRTANATEHAARIAQETATDIKTISNKIGGLTAVFAP